MSLVDFVTARELSYAAARAKDSGKRCDIEAGMAKLLAARAAWSNADAALQIHGGNGYRSEEHTSELQSLMRISYAVFCLKKKIISIHHTIRDQTQSQYHSLTQTRLIPKSTT